LNSNSPTVLPGFGTVRTRRRIFWCYAVLVFISTHWPRLTIPSFIIKRPDLLIHLSVFGTWAAIFIGADFFRPAISPKNLAKAWLIAVLYAAFDEGTQAFEFVHRTAAWDDYGFNCIGVTLGTFAMLALGRVTGARGTRAADISTVEPESVPSVK
jgi:hypothetical protein